MRPTLAFNNSNKHVDIRLGLIGAGRWGLNYIRTIADCDGLSLNWVSSRNPETKSLVPDTCQVTDTWRNLITEDDLDGIIITTPPACHAEIALAAIQQGLAVMIEKPLTLSLAEAKKLLKVAQDHQAVTLVDHTHLFHPAYIELKNRLSSDLPIKEIRGCAGQMGPFRKDTPVLWDWAAHDIAMCIDLIRETPSQVNAREISSKQLPDGEGKRYNIELYFEGDIAAHIEIGNDMTEKQRSLSVIYDESELIYDGCNTNSLILNSYTNGTLNYTQNIPVPDIPPLTYAVKDFANRIKENDKSTDSLRLGIDVVRVLSECEKSLTI